VSWVVLALGVIVTVVCAAALLRPSPTARKPDGAAGGSQREAGPAGAHLEKQPSHLPQATLAQAPTTGEFAESASIAEHVPAGRAMPPEEHPGATMVAQIERALARSHNIPALAVRKVWNVSFGLAAARAGSPRGKGLVYRVLTAYVVFCAYEVLLLQALSPFLQVRFWPVLVGTVLGLAVIVRLVVPHPRYWRAEWQNWREAVPLRALVTPASLPFLIVLPPLLVLLLAQGWHFPPNDQDALNYHLARAAYWRQFHGLGHYYTTSGPSVAYPGNVEALFTWLLVLFSSGRPVFFVQLCAYAASVLGIYGIGRSAGSRPCWALYGAGLFATMPEVVLQSNGSDVDITACSFLVCCVYFLVRTIRGREGLDLLWAGCALGLAVGAKPISLFALGGVSIVGWFLVAPRIRGASVRRRHLITLGVSLLLACPLALPWYLENLVDFGSLSGSSPSAPLVDRPSLEGFLIVLARHLVSFLDPSGPAMMWDSTNAWLGGHVNDLRSWLATALGVDAVYPPIEWPAMPRFSPRSPSYFQDAKTWFGFGGAVAVYGSIGVVLRGFFRPKPNILLLCAAGGVCSLVCTSLLLRWQPWESHLLTGTVALCCPAISVVGERLAGHRMAVAAWGVLAIYSSVGAVVAVDQNLDRPFSAWSETYNKQMAGFHLVLLPELDAVDRLVPGDAHLGVMIPQGVQDIDWEFPLFGPNMTRTVVQIDEVRSSTSKPASQVRFIYWGPFDYLLTHIPDSIVAAFLVTQPRTNCVRLWQGSSTTQGPFSIYRCKRVTEADLYRNALRAQSQRDFGTELLELGEIARNNPNFRQSLFARGWAEWNLGQRSAAVADYRAYLKLHAGDPQAQLNLGYSLIEMGRCGEAVGPLHRALDLHPSWPAARTDLALCGVR
jgi:hypothetical protein